MLPGANSIVQQNVSIITENIEKDGNSAQDDEASVNRSVRNTSMVGIPHYMNPTIGKIKKN